MATGRPAFGARFHTANEEAALLARGFQYGTAPNALVIGWNGHHTAVTLPDGTPVSSGEGGGVRIGGGGAYQPQFNHHMFLPMDSDGFAADEVPADVFNAFPADAPDEPVVDEPVVINLVATEIPAPEPDSAPADGDEIPVQA